MQFYSLHRKRCRSSVFFYLGSVTAVDVQGGVSFAPSIKKISPDCSVLIGLHFPVLHQRSSPGTTSSAYRPHCLLSGNLEIPFDRSQYLWCYRLVPRLRRNRKKLIREVDRLRDCVHLVEELKFCDEISATYRGRESYVSFPRQKTAIVVILNLARPTKLKHPTERGNREITGATRRGVALPTPNRMKKKEVRKAKEFQSFP